MYPGGGELRSVEWEPVGEQHRRELNQYLGAQEYQQTGFGLCSRNVLEKSDQEAFPTYQSQHALLVCGPESRVVQLFMGRQEVHVGRRVLEKQNKTAYLKDRKQHMQLRHR